MSQGSTVSGSQVQSLQAVQRMQGGIFAAEGEVTEGEVAEGKIPVSFGNDRVALSAAVAGAALVDRSHWGRIRVTGADRLRFLHNQTTHNLQVLQPGQGCDTVFVTSTGRTIDLATAYVLEDAVLLLVSPGYSQKLIEWMDRFIFFADKVELKDITDETIAFSLLGAGSDAVISQIGLGVVVGPPASHQRLQPLAALEDSAGIFSGDSVEVAVGSGLALPGYTLICQSDQAARLWQTLTGAGAVPLGEQLWERLRIEQGRPAAGQELTEDFNPLEAGLWQTISLNKGCYIGQETIARLHSYRGVKQQLWGIRLSQAAAPGSPVFSGAEKIGKLTSCVQTEAGALGLAYIRSKALRPDESGAESDLVSDLALGLPVQVDDRPAELVALPFVSHEYP